MGYCGKFGYTLWAIAADLVTCYGALRGMNLYSKKSVTISALWAIAQDWFCAIGHSTGFSYMLWAVAKDLVKC
jgi:hypothetical protein